MTRREELERLRDAVQMADAALAGANMDMGAVWRKIQAALATLDALIAQEGQE